MLKKTVLLIGLISGVIKSSNNMLIIPMDEYRTMKRICQIGAKDTQVAIICGVVGMCAASSAVYLYCREANATKVEKVERLWRHVNDNVAKINQAGFSVLLPVFKDFDLFAYELKKDLGLRYLSWITPWNWVPSMRLAYKKATLLNILFSYIDVLRYWQPVMSDHAIKALAETVSAATATEFVNKLNADMDTVHNIMNDVHCQFGVMLCEHLKAIRDITMQSNVYRCENARPMNAV